MFKPLNTADHTTSYRKVLLYALHGWGKTTQAKYYQKKYGKGLILSGESGLASVRSAGIDYLPFSSWNGESQRGGGTLNDPAFTHDPTKDVYSFRGIIGMLSSPDFKAMGYNWIMVDSLTELADMAFRFADLTAQANPGKDGKVNGFAIWEDYGAALIGACKWIRDLPMHVIVTALAKEGEDENGNKEHWPMVKGKQAQTQLPGIFDCVLCGVKRSEGNPADPTAAPKTTHYIITDEFKGWHGKVRDEKRRLKSVERESDITKLFDRMEMADDEYETYQQTQGVK